MKNFVALLMLVMGIGAIAFWQWMVVPNWAQPYQDPQTGYEYLRIGQLNELTYRQIIVTTGWAVSVAGLLLLILPTGREQKS